MKPICKIIKPGLLSTIQDLGRYGFQKDGIVVSGAMDHYSLQMANLLVGNDRHEAAIEITILGPVIEFLDNVFIAITGAEADVYLDEKKIPVWSAFPVKKGQLLTFSPVKKGCRLYLAVRGGFAVRQVLRSKSTYLAGKIGKQLEKEDILFGKEVSFVNIRRRLTETLIPKMKNKVLVRVIKGPEYDRFTEQGKANFFQKAYIVTKDANRMGYRLDGAPIFQKENEPHLFSDAVTFGTIQIPSDGKPIILMAERQTTGGYPRIANVITVDLPKIAQLVPGNVVLFSEIELEEAQKLMRAQEKMIRGVEIGSKLL